MPAFYRPPDRPDLDPGCAGATITIQSAVHLSPVAAEQGYSPLIWIKRKLHGSF
jgi:hypothetical protein